MIDMNKILTAKEFIWYRNAMGLTQKQMANKLGVTKQTICNLEHNRTRYNKKIYSICYQQFWEVLYSEEEKAWRRQLADLGVNVGEASDELIKLAKENKLK